MIVRIWVTHYQVVDQVKDPSGCRVGANGFRPAPSPGPTPPPLHPLRVTTHGRPVATMWLDRSSDDHGAG